MSDLFQEIDHEFFEIEADDFGLVIGELALVVHHGAHIDKQVEMCQNLWIVE